MICTDLCRIDIKIDDERRLFYIKISGKFAQTLEIGEIICYNNSCVTATDMR